MIGIVLTALAAGCASALMFASITSGALVSLVLFYLAPLPLMVSAIGWGPLSAAIGGIAAAGGLGAILGLPYCLAFAVSVALPAWWLGHLALLGRPITRDAQAELEWYPVGRLLLWISGFAILTTLAALLTLGTDAEAITATMKRGLLRMIGPRDGDATGEIELWVDAMVMIAPAAAVMMTTMTLTLNLWLAAKITATSGRLHRPWPDLRSAALPPMTLVALCIAIGLSFGNGLIAIVALIVTTSLMTAYALTGFAVIHTLTLALKSRAFWLGSIYVVVVLFVWPVIAIVMLGLADGAFGFRQRYLRSRPPPLPAP